MASTVASCDRRRLRPGRRAHCHHDRGRGRRRRPDRQASRVHRPFGAQAASSQSSTRSTGVGNVRALRHRVSGVIERAGSTGLHPALVAIDLDRFKQVNDLYSHSTGDQVLVAVARAVSDHVQIEELVARRGGDEFVVVLRDADPRVRGYGGAEDRGRDQPLARAHLPRPAADREHRLDPLAAGRNGRGVSTWRGPGSARAQGRIARIRSRGARDGRLDAVGLPPEHGRQSVDLLDGRAGRRRAPPRSPTLTDRETAARLCRGPLAPAELVGRRRLRDAARAPGRQAARPQAQAMPPSSWGEMPAALWIGVGPADELLGAGGGTPADAHARSPQHEVARGGDGADARGAQRPRAPRR